ncbi:hypothetical protein [Motilibacter aurantiacus]|uniref:hypothetical protein n=1 Tax=Motilibacter aurantiacus TaxID=2714955 RepID=UPI00140878A3|nr:hypothetical protein [Motilibacter aurantiacus]NHC47198.1 hypothetical protein [Motilibacter aurantiacus]
MLPPRTVVAHEQRARLRPRRRGQLARLGGEAQPTGGPSRRSRSSAASTGDASPAAGPCSRPS